MTTTTTTRPATEKQTAFITRLLDEKDLTGTAFEAAHADAVLLETILDNLDTRAASTTIDRLMALPRKAEGTAPAATEVPEGMHHTTEGIFKVQRAVHGSGNLYAKQLVERDGAWTFEYAPGVVRNLSEDTLMTLEGAKAFGALYGTCCVCAKVLTNEESIAEGIGPVCRSKM